jgi:SAM-dependent methyltransferase
MVPEELRPELTIEFLNEYEGLFDQHLGSSPVRSRAALDSLIGLKQHTIRNFGFEWIEYARFGWDDPVYNIQMEEAVFRRKSLLVPEELRGKLVLDGGCGNGRYTYWAAQHGARVIGVDLGDGVESASQNTVSLPEVQIVQADLFNLPFADQTFDAIFSIGVLMHTGDARRATQCLAGKLQPGGSLTVHLYGTGNLIYEGVDAWLRRRTTRLTIPELQAFTKRAFQLRRGLERVRLAGIVERFVRLDPHPHCIFDWYAAPIATHHTYSQVRQWYRDLGLRVVATNETRHPLKARVKQLTHPFLGRPKTITVKGVAA